MWHIVGPFLFWGGEACLCCFDPPAERTFMVVWFGALEAQPPTSVEPSSVRVLLLRPSDVRSALGLLEAGQSKGNQFCEAFYEFKLGRVCVAAANDIVERGSADLFGDTAFNAACEILTPHYNSLASFTTVASTMAAKAHFDKASCKCLAALSSWSSARTEEQFDQVSALAAKLTSFVEHAYGLALKYLCDATMHAIRNADMCGDAWMSSGWIEGGSIVEEAMKSFKELNAAAGSVSKEIDTLVTHAEELSHSLAHTTLTISTVAKVEKRVKDRVHDDSAQVLANMKFVGDAIKAVMEGLRHCETVLMTDLSNIDCESLLDAYVGTRLGDKRPSDTEIADDATTTPATSQATTRAPS